MPGDAVCAMHEPRFLLPFRKVESVRCLQFDELFQVMVSPALFFPDLRQLFGGVLCH